LSFPRRLYGATRTCRCRWCTDEKGGMWKPILEGRVRLLPSASIACTDDQGCHCVVGREENQLTERNMVRGEIFDRGHCCVSLCISHHRWASVLDLPRWYRGMIRRCVAAPGLLRYQRSHAPVMGTRASYLDSPIFESYKLIVLLVRMTAHS
jgi:hypothetical protein